MIERFILSRSRSKEADLSLPLASSFSLLPLLLPLPSPPFPSRLFPTNSVLSHQLSIIPPIDSLLSPFFTHTHTRLLFNVFFFPRGALFLEKKNQKIKKQKKTSALSLCLSPFFFLLCTFPPVSPPYFSTSWFRNWSTRNLPCDATSTACVARTYRPLSRRYRSTSRLTT